MSRQRSSEAGCRWTVPSSLWPTASKEVFQMGDKVTLEEVKVKKGASGTVSAFKVGKAPAGAGKGSSRNNSRTRK